MSEVFLHIADIRNKILGWKNLLWKWVFYQRFQNLMDKI